MSKDGSAYIYLVSEEGNGEIYRFVGVHGGGSGCWNGRRKRRTLAFP